MSLIDGSRLQAEGFWIRCSLSCCFVRQAQEFLLVISLLTCGTVSNGWPFQESLYHIFCGRLYFLKVVVTMSSFSYVLLVCPWLSFILRWHFMPPSLEFGWSCDSLVSNKVWSEKVSSLSNSTKYWFWSLQQSLSCIAWDCPAIPDCLMWTDYMTLTAGAGTVQLKLLIRALPKFLTLRYSERK